MAWIIDDLSRPFPEASNGARWELLSDRVMGGVSSGHLARVTLEGRRANRMQGAVSLENNGGFLQMALDLDPAGNAVDASGFSALEIEVLGNGEAYGLHLRSSDLSRPWQSYRQGFSAAGQWQSLRLPLDAFAPHRTDIPLNLARLRRIGFVAIGRAFHADLAVAGARFV